MPWNIDTTQTTINAIAAVGTLGAVGAAVAAARGARGSARSSEDQVRAAFRPVLIPVGTPAYPSTEVQATGMAFTMRNVGTGPALQIALGDSDGVGDTIDDRIPSYLAAGDEAVFVPFLQGHMFIKEEITFVIHYEDLAGGRWATSARVIMRAWTSPVVTAR